MRVSKTLAGFGDQMQVNPPESGHLGPMYVDGNTGVRKVLLLLHGTK